MGTVQRANNPAVMGTDGFADEVKAIVGCWACQCCVKMLELARPEFSVGSTREYVVVPAESLNTLCDQKQFISCTSVLRDGLRRRRQSLYKAFRR